MPIDLPDNSHLPPRAAPLTAGDEAPDFTLLDSERQPVSLSQLLERSNSVVLSFFPFAFTSVCGKEMTDLTHSQERFAARGAAVVGISCDSFAALKAWKERDGIGITLLSDWRRQVCRACGLWWSELETASRGTLVVGPGRAVLWASAREPSCALDVEEALAALDDATERR